MKKLLLVVIAGALFIFFIVNSRQQSGLETKTVSRDSAGPRTIHGIPVQVVEVAPKHLKVINSFRVTKQEDINSYIEKRKPQLYELAKATPNRDIEVVVSPSAKMPLEGFGRKAAEHGLLLSELSLDIFVDNAWHHTVWLDKDNSMVNLSQEPSALARRIIEIESSSSNPSQLGQSSVIAQSSPAPKMEVAIRYARGRMNARSAERLQGDPAFLLVDPTTDLADEFASTGRNVRVYQMPQLYVERELRWGTLYKSKVGD
jgi:hypothetical protein